MVASPELRAKCVYELDTQWTMSNNVYMSATPTQSRTARSNSGSPSKARTTNRKPSNAVQRVPARSTRRLNGRHRLLAVAGVIALTLWLGAWAGGAVTLVYGAHLLSTGWTWRRVALHLVGTAIAVSLVVFIAQTFGAGPGLMAAVVAALAWRWDRRRPVTKNAVANVVDADHTRPVATQTATKVVDVDLETQLEAAFAEGFNRGQREAHKVRRAMERSVPAFDPNDPDSF